MSSRYAIRQYTPPTCTLEVIAEESPLSRWIGRPVLKHLRFQLSFNTSDPNSRSPVVIRGDRVDLEALHTAVEDYVQQILNRDGEQPAAVPFHSDHQGILLQPQGVLSHELTLGTLARDSISTVRLSTLQLSDLAAALDEFADEAEAIPTLNRGQGFQSPPAWLRAVAAIVVAIGVTTATVKWSEQSDPTLQNTSPETAQLESRRGIPGTSSSSSPVSPSTSSAPPPASTTPTAPPSVSRSPVSPSPKAAPPPAPAASPSSATKQPVATARGPLQSPVRPSPQPTPNSQPSRPVSQPSIALARPEKVVIGQTADATNQALSSSSAREMPPTVAPEGQLTAETRARSDVSRAAPMGIPAAPAPAGPSAMGASSDRPTTAFDVIPQVGEVRQRMQQRWQPPTDLTGLLEYRLTIAPNGTVEKVFPIGQRATFYINSPGIPKVGEGLTSPINQGRSILIRLVLYPDGTVQTFMEEKPNPSP